MSFTFINVELSHSKVCALLDSQCFETEAFDESMISSLLSTSFVSGLLLLNQEKIPMGYSLFSHNGNEGDLLTLAVLPEIRGQGHGKNLLQQTLSLVKKNNIEKLFLEVRVSNKSAIMLYQKQGAENTGMRKNYYALPHSNQKEDALIMCFNFKKN